MASDKTKLTELGTAVADLGAAAALPKPFDLAALHQALHAAVGSPG